MRCSTLYVKLLLSFGLMLVAVVALIAFWFTFSFHDPITQEALTEARYTAAHIRRGIRMALEIQPGVPLEHNNRLEAYLDDLARMYRAKGWLVDADGNPILSSVPEYMPTKDLGEEHRFDDMTVYVKESMGGRDLYITMPVDVGLDAPGTLHAMFTQDFGYDKAVRRFLRGLLVIVGLVALCIVPVSRFISRPLNRLHRATLDYAGGNLSARVPVSECRHDEIGRLSRGFNTMADSLERLVRGSRELVANVSHELRSPLARLSLSLDLARKGWEKGDTATAHRHLAAIRSEMEELDDLIGRILAISRFDLREKAAPAASFDLAELARRLCDRYREAGDTKGVTCVKQLVDPVAALGDADLMELVGSNLLDNAVKFCPRGGRIDVRCSAQGDEAVLAVVNTASPLSERDLSDIFRPFHRVAGSAASGYGLGLALVQKAVESMHGEVTAVNVPEGLRVEVRLPLAGSRGGVA